jgi:hypothetical protein
MNFFTILAEGTNLLCCDTTGVQLDQSVCSVFVCCAQIYVIYVVVEMDSCQLQHIHTDLIINYEYKHNFVCIPYQYILIHAIIHHVLIRSNTS